MCASSCEIRTRTACRPRSFPFELLRGLQLKVPMLTHIFEQAPPFVPRVVLRIWEVPVFAIHGSTLAACPHLACLTVHFQTSLVSLSLLRLTGRVAQLLACCRSWSFEPCRDSPCSLCGGGSLQKKAKVSQPSFVHCAFCSSEGVVLYGHVFPPIPRRAGEAVQHGIVFELSPARGREMQVLFSRVGLETAPPSKP